MAENRGEARRASLRLKALNLALRLLAKPQLARETDVARSRREFDLAGCALTRPPPGALYLPGEIAGPGGSLPVLHVSVGAVDRRRVVLYLHGGAFVSGSAAAYRAMLAWISAEAGVPVVAPDYRLAPEHPFPAALEDAEAAFRQLYARGYEPGQIALAGDSAGGGLAFALLARLCRQGQVPAAALGFSPWVDLSGGSASVIANATADPFLPAERLVDVAEMYLQGHPAEDPEASPLFADFPGAPPVLLVHAETEILRDDSLRLAHRLRGFGAAVRVESWPEPPHVWPFLGGWLPEARAALALAGGFLRAALRPEPGRPAGS